MESARSLKRFRISKIEGPAHEGMLNQFHDYHLKLELDPGEPYLRETGLAIVRFFDAQYWGLAFGNPEDPPHRDEAIGRVAYYAIQKLSTILGLPGARSDHFFQARKEEVNRLRQIDPGQVDIQGRKEIEDQV